MGMRMSHNGRDGLEDWEPQSDILRDLVEPKSCPQSCIAEEVHELCDRLEIPKETFEGWGDDEFRGLTLELAESLKIPTSKACQLLAKIKGASERTEAAA